MAYWKIDGQTLRPRRQPALEYVHLARCTRHPSTVHNFAREGRYLDCQSVGIQFYIDAMTHPVWHSGFSLPAYCRAHIWADAENGFS